jgi:hypothetical protein
LSDSIAFTRLVIQLVSASDSMPVAHTRVMLTPLAPTTAGSNPGTPVGSPGPTIILVPDGSGVARTTVRAGRYAARSIGIGYVERSDTIATRAGVADTLRLDMRQPLFCFY